MNNYGKMNCSYVKNINHNYLNKKCIFTLRRRDEPFKEFNKEIRYHLSVKKVPLFHNLAKFKLIRLKLNEEEDDIIPLSEFTEPRGWKGRMSYYQATNILKGDTAFIDEDSRIILKEQDFMIGMKDFGMNFEVAFYPKQTETPKYCFIETEVNKIVMYDKKQYFPGINEGITSKYYCQMPYPCIHKNVNLEIYEQDEEFQPVLLSDLIKFV